MCKSKPLKKREPARTGRAGWLAGWLGLFSLIYFLAYNLTG